MQAMPGIKLNAAINGYSLTPVNVTACKTFLVKRVQQDDPARMQGGEQIYRQFNRSGAGVLSFCLARFIMRFDYRLIFGYRHFEVRESVVVFVCEMMEDLARSPAFRAINFGNHLNQCCRC
jgi:hypothetical protein